MIKTEEDKLADMLLAGLSALGIKVDLCTKSTDLDGYDIILATSLRWDVLDMVINAQQKAVERLYYIDGEDDPFIRSIYEYAKIYFKSEKLINPSITSNFASRPYAHIRHVVWIALGSKKQDHLLRLLNNQNICGLRLQNRSQKIESINHSTLIKASKEKLEKIYDVSFIMASGKNGMRLRFADKLNRLCKAKGYKAYINTAMKRSDRISYKQYMKIVKQSKVSISLRGSGWDSIRYWDITALGTCLLSEELPIEIKNNFIDRKEAVFFKDFGDFTDKLEWAISKDNRYEQIAERGRRKFDHYHNPRHRAEYLLNTIKGIS